MLDTAGLAAAVWSLTAKGDRYVQNPAGAGNPYETMKARLKESRGCCYFLLWLAAMALAVVQLSRLCFAAAACA